MKFLTKHCSAHPDVEESLRPVAAGPRQAQWNKKQSSEIRSGVPNARSKVAVGKVRLFLPFLNCNEKAPKSGEERIRQQERGQNSETFHFIKVGRNFLLHSEMTLGGPTGKFLEGFTLAKKPSCC